MTRLTCILLIVNLAAFALEIQPVVASLPTDKVPTLGASGALFGVLAAFAITRLLSRFFLNFLVQRVLVAMDPGVNQFSADGTTPP